MRHFREIGWAKRDKPNHKTNPTKTFMLVAFASSCATFATFSSLDRRALFGQRQHSRPLARFSELPVLNGFLNNINRDQNQSDLSDLTLSMRRVKSVNPVLNLARSRDSWCWSFVSGDENAFAIK